MRWRILRLRAREAELLVLVDAADPQPLRGEGRAEEARARAEEARAEAERHREVAERATAQAEEASRTKSRFLANVSHELRTPLNAIIGYSEMLSEEASDEGRPALVRDLEKVRTAALHQLDLINSVLDLAKIEAGRLDLDLETFSVAPARRGDRGDREAAPREEPEHARRPHAVRRPAFTMTSDPMKAAAVPLQPPLERLQVHRGRERWSWT